MQALLNIKTSTELPREVFLAELVLAETRANMLSKVRFHMSFPLWKLTDEITPEVGMEVSGYNLEWVDEEENPDGICHCYLNEDDSWSIAKWCKIHNEWHTINTDDEYLEDALITKPPTYWAYKLLPPKIH